MGLYFSSGFLLYMGPESDPTLAAAKIVPQSRPFYEYTNTPECLYSMLASFPISDTMSIHHTNGLEHYQHYFQFPALRIFSIRIYLNVVSAILYSRHYKSAASHLRESISIKVHASDPSALFKRIAQRHRIRILQDIALGHRTRASS